MPLSHSSFSKRFGPKPWQKVCTGLIVSQWKLMALWMITTNHVATSCIDHRSCSFSFDQTTSRSLWLRLRPLDPLDFFGIKDQKDQARMAMGLCGYVGVFQNMVNQGFPTKTRFWCLLPNNSWDDPSNPGFASPSCIFSGFGWPRYIYHTWILWVKIPGCGGP